MDRPLHIAKERLVLTYEPVDWPMGVITGYLTDDNGFVLEHIISFDKRHLIGLAKAGMREAYNHHLDYVKFYIARDMPKARQLDVLARKFGFEIINTDHVINTYIIRIKK
jgi:hypothetical protein